MYLILLSYSQSGNESHRGCPITESLSASYFQLLLERRKVHQERRQGTTSTPERSYNFMNVPSCRIFRLAVKDFHTFVWKVAIFALFSTDFTQIDSVSKPLRNGHEIWCNLPRGVSMPELRHPTRHPTSLSVDRILSL